MNQKSKTCLISGGTRGIGLAICHALAQRGYNIATFSRTQEQLDTFVGKMAAYPVKTFVQKGNATDSAFLKNFVEQTREALGSIDLLINNAGLGKMDPLADAKIEDWQETLHVNLHAAMILTKFALEYLKQSPQAAIINIASAAGKMSIGGALAYSASKFGLVGFTSCLFEEIRELGIKVSAICPGYVDTTLIPTRKALIREEMIRPEDIARTVTYILDCSPSACPVEIIIRPQKNPFRK